MLMSTTPMSGSILAHFFTKDEKISFFKSLGIIIGFSGILFLFFDQLIINDKNYICPVHSNIDHKIVKVKKEVAVFNKYFLTNLKLI